MLFCYWLLIAQIVLESFPISSSGHVKLLELSISRYNYLADISLQTLYSFSSYGAVVVDILAHYAHGPTLIIIALFFYKQWSWLLLHLRRSWSIIAKIIGLTFVADCVTALFFIAVQGRFSSPHALCFGLVVTACMLWSLRYCPSYPRSSWNLSKALLLGGAQGIALIPGISRFACTYTAARWLRLPHHKALQISFLIQWPLICAGFLHSLYAIHIHNLTAQFLNWHVGLIMLGSGIIAWYGLRMVAYLSATDRMWWFALYMIVPITVCAWLLAS